MKNLDIRTPSEFYRRRRPEYFSDTKVNYDVVLTREVLALEIEKISTNQKQDLFEGFCRRIVEKLITPNLIPQTGPTGGGDGKTDAETFPVSEEISNRWFIPENGWNKDEKWAFAFSSKKTWKSKAKSDIKNILSTKRDYSRIYFISNQTIASKKRKDAQDEFIEEYKIDVYILDGTWLLEEVFKNNFIDIAVDSLNLSTEYKSKSIIQGSNDIEKGKLLDEIESKLQNPNRYSEFDYQKVEDAIEAAILARQLEKPRAEIEGKFDRASRYCKKLNFNRHWIRIHYQKAWTYLYYYDDYPEFITEFKNLKKYISSNSTSDELELYVNLFSSLRGFCNSNCNLHDYQIDIEKEKDDLYGVLETIAKDKTRINSSLIAEIDLSIQRLMDSISEGNDPKPLFLSLYESFTKSKGLIDFPFYAFNKIFEEIGNLFPNNIEYDNLLDLIASIAEKRTSEITSGKIFLQRGIQKYINKYTKESVVYFGKAVYKLAKEEVDDGLNLAIRSLGHAFNDLGLYWASNNCFISANFFAFRSWHQIGKLDKRTYECTKLLAINELLIGRFPPFFMWYELLNVISSQIEIDESNDEFPTLQKLDAFLSVRLANTNSNENEFALLPEILDFLTLWNSQNISLYKLGYSDLILKEYEKIDIKTETELHKLFEMVANQPFRKQMAYETDFMSSDEIVLKSVILGCTFKFIMQNDIELILAAETFAAFFENYLSTSIKELFAKTEIIEIRLIRNENVKIFDFTVSESGAEYQIEIDKFSFSKEIKDEVNKKIIDLNSRIIASNFFTDDAGGYFKNLYKNESINERLAFVYEHRNFSINLLGDNPKLLFKNWAKDKKEYKLKFNDLTKFKIDQKEKNSKEITPEAYKQSRHDDNKVVSIIIDKFWDQAKWKGFGPFYAPQFGYGVFLAFENGTAAKQIFDNWIKRFGKEDIENIIKITLIKGVDKKNPYWYKVHITANIHSNSFDSKERFLTVTARFHKMTPDNSENMNRIEQIVKSKIKFLFCPAEITSDGKDINPYFDYGITINSLDIKNAWELGIHDTPSVAIQEDDDPIIPDDKSDAPIIDLMKKRNKK